MRRSTIWNNIFPCCRQRQENEIYSIISEKKNKLKRKIVMKPKYWLDKWNLNKSLFICAVFCQFSIISHCAKFISISKISNMTFFVCPKRIFGFSASIGKTFQPCSLHKRYEKKFYLMMLNAELVFDWIFIAKRLTLPFSFCIKWPFVCVKNKCWLFVHLQFVLVMPIANRHRMSLRIWCSNACNKIQTEW